jgi:hypothetical protein
MFQLGVLIAAVVTGGYVVTPTACTGYGKFTSAASCSGEIWGDALTVDGTTYSVMGGGSVWIVHEGYGEVGEQQCTIQIAATVLTVYYGTYTSSTVTEFLCYVDGVTTPNAISTTAAVTTVDSTASNILVGTTLAATKNPEDKDDDETTLIPGLGFAEGLGIIASAGTAVVGIGGIGYKLYTGWRTKKQNSGTDALL